jgi:putative nucleotidyltransferase with HDIG domain
MSAVVWSFLGGWWARLFGRAGRSRGPEEAKGEEVPLGTRQGDRSQADYGPERSEVHSLTLVATKSGVAPSREVLQQALAETLGAEVLEGEMPELDAAGAAALRSRTLDELKHLQQIPALQSFTRELLSTLGRVDVDVADVVERVVKDSALCVRILRMANSVTVGSEQRIEDLNTAVQMLGVSQVGKMAQTLFTLRDGNRLVDGFDWRHLWLHAIATASIADELDRQLRGEPPAALHVAALLHDVGKIVLSTVAPEEYRAILVATWQERGRLEELERRRLGVDHREAGVHFARQSGLSEMVVQAIAHHDRPEEAESCRFEVALVSLANHICKLHGLGFSGARLDASEMDFAALPAWTVIAEELGRHPNIGEIEAKVDSYAATVRAELREMQAGVR